MSDNDPGVAALAVFGIFIMPIIGWIVVRALAHRERMEMIRHGIVPPVKVKNRDWQRTAAAQATAPPSPRRSCEPDFSALGERIALRRGIRLTFIGIAITVGLSFIGYHDGPVGGTWRPGPWLLGGLIPTFIGLAQVVSSMLAGASFGTMSGPGFVSPPPLGEPPFSPPPRMAPTYDSSYTYRPGDAAELRPPPMPPERR